MIYRYGLCTLNGVLEPPISHNNGLCSYLYIYQLFCLFFNSFRKSFVIFNLFGLQFQINILTYFKHEMNRDKLKQFNNSQFIWFCRKNKTKTHVILSSNNLWFINWRIGYRLNMFEFYSIINKGFSPKSYFWTALLLYTIPKIFWMLLLDTPCDYLNF